MSTESIHEHGLKHCEKFSPVIGQQLAHEYFDVISFSFLFFYFLIIFCIFRLPYLSEFKGVIHSLTGP